MITYLVSRKFPLLQEAGDFLTRRILGISDEEHLAMMSNSAKYSKRLSSQSKCSIIQMYAEERDRETKENVKDRSEAWHEQSLRWEKKLQKLRHENLSLQRQLLTTRPVKKDQLYAGARRGRKAGTGTYDDEIHLLNMHEMRSLDRALSIHKAAQKIDLASVAGASPEAKVHRLMRKYAKKYYRAV